MRISSLQSLDNALFQGEAIRCQFAHKAQENKLSGTTRYSFSDHMTPRNEVSLFNTTHAHTHTHTHTQP